MDGLRPLAAVGVLLGVVALKIKIDQGHHTGADVVMNGAAAYLFLLSGVIAGVRRPANRVGLLMVLAGIGLFVEDLQMSSTPWVTSVGQLLTRSSSGFLAHLILVFPTGRLTSRLERALVVAAYTGVFVLAPIRTTVANPVRLPQSRQNLFLIVDDEWLSGFLDRAIGVLGAVVAAGVLCVLVRRWRRAGRPLRRVLAPVFLAALIGGAATAIGGALGPHSASRTAALWVYWVALCLLPLGFLAGVLRVRLGRTAVGELLTRLHEPVSAAELRVELARALGDPSLTVGYWRPETQSYVDGGGLPLVLPADGSDRAVRFVERGGHRVAVLVHDPALDEDPHLLSSVTAAAGLALENQRLTAEVRAQLAEVQASRGRIVAAGDASRRRLERDLHDGAQQRLITVALGLRRVSETTGEESAALLAGCAADLDAAIGELRELARGIHPALLTDLGLDAALRALADRVPLDVHLTTAGLSGPDTESDPENPADPPRPGPVAAATAYFVVAEALTNTLKHARATRAAITVGLGEGSLRVEVEDNGIGGADIMAGEGLLGLQDRVLALGGTLDVRGGPGGGTSVVATIPEDHATPPTHRPT